MQSNIFTRCACHPTGTSSGLGAVLELEKLHQQSVGEIFVEADFAMLELTYGMLSA